jgi:dihydropteroate synthase
MLKDVQGSATRLSGSVSLQFNTRWEARGRTIVSASGAVPKVMGIVNLTPDSFSDGGRLPSHLESVSFAQGLAGQGAELLDLGGESSRPGAGPVSLEQELSRVIPVLRMLSDRTAVPISIDTTKAEVARAALAGGASIINDITALSADPEMAKVGASFGAGVVLMHMQGTPATMQANPHYADVVTEVYDFLARRIEWAEARGIPRERIAIDPGIGFGKTREHNLDILRNLERFANLGCAIMVGVSRKGFLGSITGRPVLERAAATVAASLEACLRGARVVRVHDVAEMADAIRVWTALGRWEFRS